MRNLLLFHLLCLVVGKALAQEPNCQLPAPFSDAARQMIKPLDKSQIPSGVLYENVLPQMQHFNNKIMQ